ncbi:MAG TPA: hypothetical protein VNZ52_11370, partial [Candidatus Thermoplasmatota archaeon]|nr:hypothetical protein [Candidatus Thermoplasmatota archaeon]
MLTSLLVAAGLAGCLAATEAADRPPPPASAAPGLSCPAPCVIAIDTGSVRWEPSVAVNPTNPLHIVASSQDQTRAAGRLPHSWGLSHVTLDGGATWQTMRLPGGPGGDPTHPLSRYTFMDDSTVAFLPDGTLLWAATM